MLNNLLKKLGFSEKEIVLYLAILKHGKIIPSDLSKITGINRTTVYSLADELSKKGVIIQDFSSNIKFFLPAPPQDLELIIKKEEAKLEKKKTVVKQAINELNHYSSHTQYTIPKLRFVMEEELKDFFFKQNDKWEKSAMETDACWYGFQDNFFVENFHEYINWYWSRPDNKMKLMLLSNKCEAEITIQKHQYNLRQIKFLKKKVPFSASTMIIGDYIIMVVSNQKPHYAIEIKNKELAKNLKELFKIFWSSFERL
jgi:predicted transcriptional regulator